MVRVKRHVEETPVVISAMVYVMGVVRTHVKIIVELLVEANVWERVLVHAKALAIKCVEMLVEVAVSICVYLLVQIRPHI